MVGFLARLNDSRNTPSNLVTFVCTLVRSRARASRVLLSAKYYCRGNRDLALRGGCARETRRAERAYLSKASPLAEMRRDSAKRARGKRAGVSGIDTVLSSAQTLVGERRAEVGKTFPSVRRRVFAVDIPLCLAVNRGQPCFPRTTPSSCDRLLSQIYY